MNQEQPTRNRYASSLAPTSLFCANQPTYSVRSTTTIAETLGDKQVRQLPFVQLHRWAFLSPAHLKEVAEGFGGLNFRVLPPGKEWRAELAHAIAARVPGAGWYYEVVESGKPDFPTVKIVITGRS